MKNKNLNLNTKQRTKRTQSNKFINKAMQFLQYIDFYGEQINLTYKGNSKYTTNIGGFVSLTITILLSIYLVIQIEFVVNYERDDISQYNVPIDQLEEIETYPYADYKFDISFGIGEQLDPTYGYFEAYQVIALSETDENNFRINNQQFEKLEVVQCQSDNFHYYNKTLLNYSDVYNSYCLKDKNYKLIGQKLSYVHKYVNITLNLCQNYTSDGEQCKSQEEIDNYFN